MIQPLEQEALERAYRFAADANRTIQRQLGSGMDGIVLATHQQTAIKALKYQKLYVTERDVYLRLREKQVQTVIGFAVPRMIGYDDNLWVIEMEIVSAPYVLDFAGAYLDRPPDFPPEVM